MDAIEITGDLKTSLMYLFDGNVEAVYAKGFTLFKKDTDGITERYDTTLIHWVSAETTIYFKADLILGCKGRLFYSATSFKMGNGPFLSYYRADEATQRSINDFIGELLAKYLSGFCC